MIQTEPPVILPFVRPSPRPHLRFWKTYVIGRRAYQMLGERWHDDETRYLDFETTADPHRPGTSFSWRLTDLQTGETIEPASAAEVEEALRSPTPRHMGA